MVEHKTTIEQERYRREYLALFTDTINSWVGAQFLNQCIVAGRRELLRVPDVIYYAAIDPASRRNNFALAIVHRSADGTIVMDRLACWRGTGKAPVPYDRVVRENKEILDTYASLQLPAINTVAIRLASFLETSELGITFSRLASRHASNFLPDSNILWWERKIELLDDVDLLRELRSLQEERSSRGHVDIRPSSGTDNRAVALALAVNEAVTQPSPSSSIRLGLPPILVSDLPNRVQRLIPGDCYVESNCRNHPRCIQDETCYGYINI